MSSFTTTHERSVGQDPQTKVSGLRLPPPGVVVGLLVSCVFLLRLPAGLVPREFNVDESQLLSEAMKFLVDPRPWKAVDSCGPLNSYFITIFLLIGFKAGYVLAHMLASLLICLQIIVAYLTLRRLASEAAAALGGALMVFLYGTYTHPHFLHYNTESLPTLLLMTGFYLFLVWLDEQPKRHTGTQLALLFGIGLVLGSAPWGKLQALPITGALGLLTAAAIFRPKSIVAGWTRRLGELAALAFGAVFTTATMLTVIAESGAIKDFWDSYIRAPLSFVGSLSIGTTLENLARVFMVTPVHQLLLVAVLGLALVDYALPAGGIRLAFERRRWALGGLLVYAGAGLFTACRSNNFWPKHAIFFIPPMTYIAALLATRGVVALVEKRRSQQRLDAGLLAPLLLVVATGAVYLAYSVRYIDRVRDIPNLSLSQAGSAGDVNITTQAKPRNGFAGLKHYLASCIGPSSWDLPTDGKMRMLAVVDSLREKGPVRSLSVWGWEPGMYVLTGLPPATRDTITERAIDPGPLQAYFQSRYVSDLRANPPDLFIDTVAKGAFIWRDWTESDGYESNPDLRKFIDENYTLVDELVLVKGEKPVRFFARKN